MKKNFAEHLLRHSKKKPTTLNILKHPSQFLRMKSFVVTPQRKRDDEKSQFLSHQDIQLLSNMYYTMTRDCEAFGISAPQVSHLKRIFICPTSVNKLRDDKGEAQIEVALEAYINPTLIDQSVETEKDIEGCLSLPNMFALVHRPKQIQIKYFNVEGEEIQTVLEGFPARAFLHEYDHLDGVLMIDRVSNMESDMISLEHVTKYIDDFGFLLEKYK